MSAEHHDVIIIGSGAGGGTLAHKLYAAATGLAYELIGNGSGG